MLLLCQLHSLWMSKLNVIRVRLETHQFQKATVSCQTQFSVSEQGLKVCSINSESKLPQGKVEHEDLKVLYNGKQLHDRTEEILESRMFIKRQNKTENMSF